MPQPIIDLVLSIVVEFSIKCAIVFTETIGFWRFAEWCRLVKSTKVLYYVIVKVLTVINIHENG